MKYLYSLIALFVLFIVSSCSLSQTTSTDTVLHNLGVAQEYDTYSNYVSAKVISLSSRKYLGDKGLRQKLNNYNDASYAYYTRAFILLAGGDIAGYEENIAKAWEMTEAMDELMNEIIANIPEKKGQGL